MSCETIFIKYCLVKSKTHNLAKKGFYISHLCFKVCKNLLIPLDQACPTHSSWAACGSGQL